MRQKGDGAVTMVRPKRNPEVVWRMEEGLREAAWDKVRQGEEFEDLGVLTLMVRGGIHQLNLVGAEIWARVNGVNTVGKIALEIAALFKAEPEEMEQDVLAFLKDLEGKGWISLGEAPSGPRWSVS